MFKVKTQTVAIVLLLSSSTLGFDAARSTAQDAPHPEQEAPRSLVDVTQDALQALLVRKVEPEFPSKAAAAHVEGPVVVVVIVGQDGSVLAAKSRCGHSLLEGAAIDAVKQWRYKHPVLHGQPVEIRSTVVVDVVSWVAPGPGQILKVDSQTAASRLVSSRPPEYPPLARTARIQGCVVVHALIDQNGKVTEAKYLSGHPMLASPAERTVKLWRYKPFMQNGKAVDVDTYVIVDFAL